MRGRRSDLWAGHGAVQREGPVIRLAESDSSAMRNERIEVRRATASDAADIAPLYLHFLQSYGHAAERSAVARFLADLLPEPWVLFFVAIDAPKKVVGFTGCVLTYSAVSQALALTINDMFVAASARRRGIATVLCGAIEAHARRNGFAKIFLETAPDAEAAIGLYRKFGFETRPYLAMTKEFNDA